MDYFGKIIDLFAGKTDLKNKIIKAIGEPDQRFDEDALRILRAFKFVAKLGFDIEENTFKSMKKNILLLKEISNERILQEMKKICAYPYSEKALKLLASSDIEKAFPEMKKALNILKSKPNFSINYLEFLAYVFILNKLKFLNTGDFLIKKKQ